MYFSLCGVCSCRPYLSKNLRCLLFPPFSIMRASACVHVSIVADRTNETCTPSERWMPEQFRQMKMPCLTDAQSGFRVGQSAQT